MVGRARERPVVAVRRLLRRRLGPARGEAAQHRAAADPRRPLRPGARGGASSRSSATARRFTRPLPRPRCCRWRPGRSTGLLAGRRRRAPATTSSTSWPRASGRLPAGDAHRPGQRWPSATATSRSCAASSPGCSTSDPATSAARRRRGGRRSTPTSTPSTRLLERQNYRLAYWRTAGASSTTGASSTSTPSSACGSRTTQVFADTHELVLRLAGATGVRRRPAHRPPRRPARPRAVPRPAGARPPAACGSWSRRSSSRARSCPTSWPVAGTTGYDFLNRRRRPVRRPRRRGRRSPSCTAGSPASRRRRGGGGRTRRKQLARATSCWPPTSTG